ncbi:MAG: universal stress protein [Longimicrobiaceae bacterium]
MRKRMLVATEGGAGSLGALRTAQALAERDGAEVEVLAVVEPALGYGPPVNGTVPGHEEIEATVARRVGDTVRRQLRGLGGGAAGWEVVVRIGSVAPTIAREAEARDADVIVLGRRVHEGLGRFLGRETALDVVRLAGVPVLAVPPEGGALPASVLVAVDFSEGGRDSARAALELLPAGGVVHLAHVSWSIPADAVRDGGQWVETYDDGARTRLDELRRVLEAPGGVRVRTHLLHGEAAPQLLALAEREGVGLIVVGSHGNGFFSRAILGSVATRVFRGARCAVLLRPLPGESSLLTREDVEEELHLTAAPGSAGGA